MDKLGGIKKALITAAMVSTIAAVPIDTNPIAQEITAPVPVRTDVSVQILYRPVLQARIPDAPKTRGDRAWQWWAEQFKRIKYGWIAPNGHYLCGYHYWYLNFVKIPRQDKLTKAISGWEAPDYRDNDDEILSQLWRNRYRDLPNGASINAKNHIQAKPRTIGWTQMEFLGVDSYHFIFTPGRGRFIGRGYPDSDQIDAERNWFKTLYTEHIPDFLKRWNGKELSVITDNDGEFAVGWKVDAKTSIPHNSILYKVVADEGHAGVFKGVRCWKITAVEAGKWKGNSLQNFWVENKDCLEGGDLKWGSFVIGGTSNQIINKSTNYKEMYFKPESIGEGTTTHFTPKTKALLGFIDLHTGKSLVDDAMRAIQNKRKAAETNPELYQKELVENPLTPQEAFEPSVSFAYDQAKINAQIGAVKAFGMERTWVQVRFEYEFDSYGHKTGRVFPVADEKGPWKINGEIKPRPDLKNLFIAGIDDTYVPLAEGQKLKPRDSRDCMVIWCRETTLIESRSDAPAALYFDKAKDTFITYEEFLKGMIYFNVENVTYEYNHEAFYNWMRERSEAHRLTWVGTRPGIQIKGGMKSEVTRLGYQIIAQDVHKNITLTSILDSLLIWGGTQNTDIGSALHCVFYQRNKMKDWPVEYANVMQHAEEKYDVLFPGMPRPIHPDIIQLGQPQQPMPRSYQQDDDFIRLGRKSRMSA